MTIEVNVLEIDGIRKPDYEGSYKVVEDWGDTMIIEVEPNLEERLEFIKTQNELALAELAEVILGGMA